VTKGEGRLAERDVSRRARRATDEEDGEPL